MPFPQPLIIRLGPCEPVPRPPWWRAFRFLYWLLVCRTTRWWIVEQGFIYRTPWGYSIKVPAGFPTNGASIPRFFWRAVGHPMQADLVEGAVVHDWLWQKASLGYTTYWHANRVLRYAIHERGVVVRLWPIWLAVTLNSFWRIRRRRESER